MKKILLTFFLVIVVSVYAKKEKIKNGIAPTFKHVKYAPYERTFINFWKAESDKPTPVFVQIHGGGWRGGKADEKLSNKNYLNRGISVASVEYRLTTTDILPMPVHDAARAIQFIRSKVKEWNIDKTRIVCSGRSAGAATSLWLATHDDLADPDNDDPVKRESTKPIAIIGKVGQTCLDPFLIKEWIGMEANNHAMIYKSVGADSAKALMDNWEKYKKLSLEFSAYHHLDKDDPPMFLIYGNKMDVPAKNKGHGIHHGMFGVKFKEKADKVGAKVYLSIPGHYKVEEYPSVHEFIYKMLKLKKAP